jgi:TetR/AcrR family fatty acid metabolism transcriptional regulator
LNVLLDKHTRLTQQNNAICIVFNVLSIEMEGVNPQFSTAIKEIHTELVDFAEHIVKKGQRTGQFRLNLDSRLTAMNIVGILKVIGCSHVFYQMDVDIVDMTDTLKQILWEGVKK